MARLVLGVAITLSLSVASCADLPVIEDDQCGNYVIDPGEDCDTYSVYPGTSCRMTAPKACHYECAPREDGTTPDCAPGMGCGADGLCRAPSGELDRVGDIDAPGAREIVVADFGGSLGAEVLAVLERRLELNYLSVSDEVDVLARITEPAVAEAGTIPLAADLSADGTTDLVTPFVNGIIANLGGPDLSLAPRAHPSLSLEDIKSVAVVFLEVLPELPGDETLTFVALAKSGAIAYSESGDAKLLAAVGGTPDGLAGEMVVGQIIEDPVTSPCRELAFAFVDAAEVMTLTPCRPAALGEGVDWNEGVEPTPTTLPSGRSVARGPLLVDLNGDDHLDLLIEAKGCAECPELLASFGIGDGTFHSRADEVGIVPSADGSFAAYGGFTVEDGDGKASKLRALPLAVGDLDGDGRQDFVTDHQIWISRGSMAQYALAAEVADETWTLARMADFNANDRLDVITVIADATGMRFYNGTPGGFLAQAFLPTARPVEQIAVGDFDGDLVLDLVTSEAFAEAAGEDEQADDLVSILFGRAVGPPEPPVVLGRLDPVVQLATNRSTSEGLVDGIDDFSAVSKVDERSFVFGGFRGRADRLIRSPFVLATQESLHFVAYAPRRLAAGQFDDDAHADLVALGYDYFEESGTEYLWNMSTTEEARFDLTHTTKSEKLSVDVDWSRSGMVALDVDDDGRDELLLVAPALAGGTVVQLFEAVGSGRDYAWQRAWQEEVAWPFSRSEDFGPIVEQNARLLLVDVEGDGREQVVALGFSESGEGELWLLPELSLGGMSGATQRIDGGGSSLRDAAVIEADGDAGRELALLTDDGVRWLGWGSAGLVDVSSNVWPIAGAHRIAAGDVDGDGLEDVVVSDGNVASILLARALNP